MPAIYDILKAVKRPGMDNGYAEKQLHKVPDFPVVENRRQWLIDRCKGKVVLDVGCSSGELSTKLYEAAEQWYGIDTNPCNLPTAQVFDLDAVEFEIDQHWERGDDRVIPKSLPFASMPINTIVCGEILEHLTNPGWALQRFAATWPGAELLITVPNAFSESGRQWLVGKHTENVNREHTAWYSWWTLTQLCERSRYLVSERFWYNGKPLVAEGLIFSCKTAEET